MKSICEAIPMPKFTVQPADVTGRVAWSCLDDLIEKYPTKPPSFIAKGIQACEACFVDPGYFVDRYLRNDKSVPVNLAVEAAYKAIDRGH